MAILQFLRLAKKNQDFGAASSEHEVLRSKKFKQVHRVYIKKDNVISENRKTLVIGMARGLIFLNPLRVDHLLGSIP